MYQGAINTAWSLRLHGIRNNLERRCQAAVAESQHPGELINLLLEDERLQRQEAAAKRMLARARFRNRCTLEEWDATFDRGMPTAKLKELASLRFFHNKENLILEGNTGVGKTHLATAIGERLCSGGYSSLFISASMLFEEVAAERAAGRYLKFIDKMVKIQALILDDFGLKTYRHEDATTLLEILERRYGKGSVIITSQVSPKGWNKLFEDPVIAEAIVDRLKNPSTQIKLTGPSYRERLEKN